MAKRRKTRKEKVTGDLRRHTPTTAASPTVSESIFSIPNSPSRSTTTTTIDEYSFLSRDLIKTAVLTSSLVIAELVLAYIMKI